jgi:hypothetical protein
LKPICALLAAATLTTAFIASPAYAQGTDEFGAYGGMEERGNQRSPQNFAFEVRFGQYPPRIDNHVGGAPYRTIFGQKKRWQGGAELDWQAFRLRKVFSVGPALGFAYTSSTAKAPISDGSGQRSAQDTTLNILPLYALGVLRLDVLAERTLVPLAPYGKLGFGYAFWWSTDGEKGARDGNIVGRDTSYGLAFALGLMVRLDWLDREDAASADASLGLNHSGLFIEWFHADLSGFGSADVMDVGSSTWVAGVTLEL